MDKRDKFIFSEAWTDRIKKIVPTQEHEAFFLSATQPLPKTFWSVPNFTIPAEWNVRKAAQIPNAFLVQLDSEEFLFGKTLEHVCGKIYSASLSSMLSAFVLSATQEDKVLDMCAAPGSKTTFLAHQMEREGRLLANEMDRKRAAALSDNVSRMGSWNTVISTLDANTLLKYFGEEFDKILLDAPCSSDGFGRKDPKFFTAQWRKNSIAEHAFLQKKLIETAFELLREDGEMVYSTCTSAPEENELMIQHLLTKYKEAEIMPIELKEIPAKNGITEWDGTKILPEIIQNVKRIFPHHQKQNWDSEIFFIAKIKKREYTHRSFYALENKKTLFEWKKNQKATWTTKMEKEFGIPKETWKNIALYEKENTIYATSQGALSLTHRLPIHSCGIPLWNKEKGFTYEFALHFGNKTTKNNYVLSDLEAKKILQGYDKEIQENEVYPNGQEIFFLWKNYCIGHGKVQNEKIKNKIPTQKAWK